MRADRDGARGARRAGRRGARAPRGAAPASGSATPTTRCWSPCARGARESMPGMLDTVLNLGLNDESVAGPGRAHRQRALRLGLLPALRADVRQRRARHRRASASRTRSRASSASAASTLDTELDVDALRELTDALQGALRLPDRPARAARAGDPRGVRLLEGERAVAYRRINRIPDDWGTAVNVQQMVFGNKGDDLGLRRRVQPRRGHRRARAQRRLPAQRPGRGRRLRRAQHRATSPSCATGCPRSHAQLMEILRTLERHYGDMQDTEFTVEEGRLYMLQTRNAKRPAQAAVRFAVDAVDEGLLDQRGGARDDRRRRRSTRCCTRPSTPTAEYEVLARGVAASPGAAKGAIVFTAADAVAAADGRARRDPRAPVHRGRRRRRLPRRQGHPHLRGRQGLARGAGGARHGRARR